MPNLRLGRSNFGQPGRHLTPGCADSEVIGVTSFSRFRKEAVETRWVQSFSMFYTLEKPEQYGRQTKKFLKWEGAAAALSGAPERASGAPCGLQAAC